MLTVTLTHLRHAHIPFLTGLFSFATVRQMTVRCQTETRSRTVVSDLTPAKHPDPVSYLLPSVLPL
jgi:hypothetical protein